MLEVTFRGVVMARLILLGLIIAGGYWLVRRVRAARERGRQRPAESFERTVRCRECGAFVARQHAVPEADGYRCRAHVITREEPR